MNETVPISEFELIKEQIENDKPDGLMEFVRSYFAIYGRGNRISLDNYINTLRQLGSKVRIVSEYKDPDVAGLREFISQRLDKEERQLVERLEKEAYETDIQEAASRYPEFPASDSFRLVESFVKRHGKSIPLEDLIKLQRLLSTKGHNFSRGELVYFVDYAFIRQHNDRVKTLVLSHAPKTRRQFLEAYLNHFAVDDHLSLEALNAVFASHGAGYENLDELKKHLLVVSDEIELRNFETQSERGDASISLSEVDDLDGYEFEDFLRKLFTKMGYVFEHTRLSGDQGADLVVVKFGEKTVIQAKCYAGNVGNYAVQEIFSACRLYGAQKGMVVTNSYFTPAAFELAEANQVELVDRTALEKMIREH